MSRFLVRALLVSVLVLGCVSLPVAAQPGPVTAQIQAALRAFLTIAHTWTATQTFSNIVVNGSCTGCGGGGTGNVSAAGTLTNNALVIGQGTTAVATVTTGTGVLTALGINVGSAGAVVTNGGALGTPASGTLTNATGLPTAGLLNAAVTLAKIQNASASSRLLGSGASGSGAAYSEITLGSSLTMTGTTLSVTAPGAWVLLESHAASASSALNFTTRNGPGQSGATFQTDYDDYVIEFVSLIPATSGQSIYVRFSTNGGSSYDNGSNYPYNFIFCVGACTTAGSSLGGSSATGTEIRLRDPITLTANTAMNATMRLFDPASTTLQKAFIGESIARDSDGIGSIRFQGMYTVNASAVNAFQVFASSGNITSGTVRVYGIAK